MTTNITMFGKTKEYPSNVYVNAAKIESCVYDKILWIERGEDWYSLDSEEYKNKKVLVVEREIWLRCKDVK